MAENGEFVTMYREKYQLSDMEPVIVRALAMGGTFAFYPCGTSMLPTIREERNQVILTSVPERLKKYQIILYKRTDGAYVLHRIVGVRDCSYMMRGDNQYVIEPDIQRDQMIAMACGIVQNQKMVDPNKGIPHLKGVLWVKTMWIRKCLNVLRWRKK